jgi:D-3-phosphoglycerate dehydrogenase
VSAEDLEVLGPFLPLCRHLGSLAVALAGGVDGIDVAYRGGIADMDTRPLTVAVLLGVLAGHTEDEVNQVNALPTARERGIDVSESSRGSARDFTDLVKVTVRCGDRMEAVIGTTLGSRHRPHLLQAWGQRFNLQLEEHLALFRYSDVPGMVGRVGTALGEHGINIRSAAVGYGEDGGEAVMLVTTDRPVPPEVVTAVASGEGFAEGRAVSLAG